jgi:hypothetical protein
MYRKALGAMNYTPERFGLMRIGSFFDAITGFNENEVAKFKAMAELVRTSTAILRNAHVFDEKDLKTAEELWHFPWDEPEEAEENQINDEIKQKAETDLLEILKRRTENGNSIKQS